MRGTIEQITTKTGRNDKGPWKKWGVKIDTGQWLSTFDKGIGAELEEGQTYDFEAEQKGNFLTITEAVKVLKVGGPDNTDQAPWPGEELTKPSPEAPKKPVAPAHYMPVVADAKDVQIARAVALKAAVEDLKGSQHSPGEVIDTAKVFLKWLEG